MRAVAYLRVSTDRQADKDLSIPAQRKAIAAWAAQHGAELVQEFVDAGESARSADRPAFLDLIAHCKRTPGIDLCLVYSLDRFSRSRFDAAVFRKILRDAGVRLVAVTQPIADSPEGEVLAGILEVFSQYYSDNLSRVIARGMRQAVEAKGSRPGGTVPYGYRQVRMEGKVTLEPNVKEADAVRRMAQLALQGLPLSGIARALEDAGIRNRAGRRFSVNQLQGLLHNRALVGDLVWGKRNSRKQGGRHPVEQWVTVPDAWPPILDRATFARVHEALASRAPTEEHPKAFSAAYLLTGLLVCGRCRSPYTVERAQVHGRAYHYYQCLTNRKGGAGACRGGRLRMEPTDRRVVDGLIGWLSEERRAAKIVALYVRRSGVDVKALDKRAAELKRWATTLEARRERLLDALEEGKIEAALLNARLARIDTERRELADHEARLSRQRDRVAPIPTVAMFQALGEQVRQVVAAGPTPAAKALLRTFVGSIEVQKGGALNVEILAGKSRQLQTSGEDFDISRDWWTTRGGGANESAGGRVWLRIA